MRILTLLVMVFCHQSLQAKDLKEIKTYLESGVYSYNSTCNNIQDVTFACDSSIIASIPEPALEAKWIRPTSNLVGTIILNESVTEQYQIKFLKRGVICIDLDEFNQGHYVNLDVNICLGKIPSDHPNKTTDGKIEFPFKRIIYVIED